MQTEALKLWAELEEESGQKLLRKHGTLNYGEPDTGETVQASRPPCSAHCDHNTALMPVQLANA